MRKLFIVALLVAVSLVFSACGSSSSLTSVQANAVKAVETNLVSYGVENESARGVVGRVAKDGQGNEVTLVHISYKSSKDSSGKSQTYDMIIIVVQKQDGTLIFADVLLPSGVVTVSP